MNVSAFVGADQYYVICLFKHARIHGRRGFVYFKELCILSFMDDSLLQASNR